MSKQVSDRVRNTRTVNTIVHDTSAETGHGIEQVLFEARTTPTLSGVELLLAFERSLERSKDELVKADKAHERELSDDAAPRARRDEQFQAVRRSMSMLRALLESVHGPESLAQMMMAETCPNDPTGAHEYARGVSMALADARIVLPPAIAPGATFDRAEWSRIVLAQAESLASALGEVKSQEIAAKQTLAKKLAAMEAHDLRLRAVVATMTSWWRVLGRDELADKLESDLRPRQPGEPEDDIEPTEASAPTAPTSPLAKPTTTAVVSPSGS